MPLKVWDIEGMTTLQTWKPLLMCFFPHQYHTSVVQRRSDV